MVKGLYDEDYYGWLLISSEQVREMGLTEVAEHLDEMTRSVERALESQFARLIAHLLKWKYQPDQQTRSWRLTIVNARSEISKVLRKNPSLKSKIKEVADDSYNNALYWAMQETGLDDFPSDLDFSLEQLLDNDFYP